MRQQQKKQVQIRFSIVQMIAWAAMAGSSYLTVYMKELGFSSQRIGVVAAIGAILALFILPAWGYVSDRLHSAKKTFFACNFITAAVMLLIAVTGKRRLLGPVFLLMILARCFLQPITPLLDGWCISSIRKYGIQYADVRIWGSIGFALFSMLVSALLSFTETRTVFFVYPALLLLLFLVSRKMEEVAPADPEKKQEKTDLRSLLKNKHYLALFLISMASTMYLSITVVFIVYVFEHAHVSTNYLGLMSGCRAFLEVAAMFAAGRLLKKLRIAPAVLLLLAASLTVLEHLLYCTAEGLPMLLCAYLMSGLGGGVVYSLLPVVVNSCVPETVMHSAQTVMGTSRTLATVIGSLVGGYAIGLLGIQRFLLVIIGFQILLILAFFYVFFIRKDTKVPLRQQPEEGEKEM